MEYISHSDYTSMLKNFGKETPKGLLKEALEETGLVSKAIAAFEKKFGNLTDQQKEKFKQAIEMDYANDDLLKATMDDLVQIFDASVGRDEEDLGHATHNGDFGGDDSEYDWDADYEEPRDDFPMAGGDHNDGEFWEGNAFTAGLAKTKKGGEFKVGSKEFTDKTNYDAPMKEMGDFSSVRARYPNNDGPFEGEMEAGSEGKTSMRDPEAAATVIAQKYGTELKLDKDWENKAIRLAGKEMIASGISKVAVGNLLSGYGPFEDWLSDYVSALAKELKGVAEGLNAPPFQATAGTVQNVKEDQAPFGLSVLSPDEQKQLREYVNSVREIKKAIQELVGKAKNGMMEASDEKGEPGGNRTDLIMTPAVTSEAKAKNPSLEKKVKDLMAKDKLTRREALEFIKAEKEHDEDKKGEEAKMSQHD